MGNIKNIWDKIKPKPKFKIGSLRISTISYNKHIIEVYQKNLIWYEWENLKWNNKSVFIWKSDAKQHLQKYKKYLKDNKYES